MPVAWTRFGPELRRHRERLGLTQDALAAKIGVRWNTIARLETGHRRPSLVMLERLAAALNCRVRDLLPEEEVSTMSRIATKREPSLKGAPSFFRALVAEASDRRTVGADMNTGRNVRLTYATPGHELARHVEEYLLEDEAQAEWHRIGALNRPEFETAVRSFVAREFPGCLALIPPKRRNKFFEGFVSYHFG